MRNIFIIILIIFLYHSFNDTGIFDDYQLSKTGMKAFSVPIQKELTPEEKKLVFKVKFSGCESTITPLYSYKIYARIYSKKHYLRAVDMMPAPYDLALGWDGLEKPEVFKTIRAWQSFRWVHWMPNKDCIYSIDQIYMRLANTHVIPANDKILQGIKKLNKKDQIFLEGYLVSFKTTRGKTYATGYSSTTRSDRKNNSCEIMYVTRLVSKYGEFK